MTFLQLQGNNTTFRKSAECCLRGQASKNPRLVEICGNKKMAADNDDDDDDDDDDDNVLTFQIQNLKPWLSVERH